MVPPFRNRESSTRQSIFRGFAFSWTPGLGHVSCFLGWHDQVLPACRANLPPECLDSRPVPRLHTCLAVHGHDSRSRALIRAPSASAASFVGPVAHAPGSERSLNTLNTYSPAPGQCRPLPTGLPGCASLQARACNRGAIHTSRSVPSRLSRRPLFGHPRRSPRCSHVHGIVRELADTEIPHGRSLFRTGGTLPCRCLVEMYQSCVIQQICCTTKAS